MRDLTVYGYSDYKSYLLDFISGHPSGGRGLRSELAAAAGCQRAYFSKVLSGNAHLSLEQAIALTSRLGLSSGETEFFLVLVQHGRAGSQRLRQHLQAKVGELRQQRQNLAVRFKVTEGLSEQAKTTYYSAWYYLAIHVALSVRALQTEDALADYFGLPLETVRDTVAFLVQAGLANPVKGSRRFEIGKNRLHLPRNSPLIRKHHVHWRLQALQSIERNRAEDLHYSAVVTVSQDDAIELRELWVRTLEKFNERVAPSPEESLRCIAIDFFKVGSM